MKVQSVARRGRSLAAIRAVALFVLAAINQVHAQTAEDFQRIAQMESNARSSRDWTGAGESWLAYASQVAVIDSHQDWVKSRVDPSKFPQSIALHKRAIACFIRAYDAEGEHSTPMSRQRSDGLRCLLRAYQSAQRFDPQNADWHYLRGEALCAQGWYVEGNKELSRAIALGGSGGSSASTLAAHIKPFVNRELALEGRLNNVNAKINEYNGNHPVQAQQVYDNATKARISGQALYFKQHYGNYH
ncbi:MAG TPA: hypothetical protein V6C86_02085 [Oculatellaceae cyanobacterium]